MTIKNPIVKKVLILFLILLAIFLLQVIYIVGKNAWGAYQWQKATDNFQESLERPYKEDVWGGKTPEETWAMFLDALKKDDLELASKYYDAGHQDKAREWLEGLKQNGELEQTIKEMGGIKKSENQPLSREKTYYSFDAFSAEYQQILTNRVVFYLNPHTNIWKMIW